MRLNNFSLILIQVLIQVIDCVYKINNRWASFHNDVTKIKETLKRNSFPPVLIDKITKSYWYNYKIV